MQAGSLNFNFVKKLVKVVTLMCARGPAPHVARGRKTLQLHGFLYKHMGKLQRAVTLILRRESKICPVKSLVSTHSACPCKNYPPKCSQTPHELDYLFKFAFFFYLVYNLVYNYLVFNKQTTHQAEKNCPETTT